MGSYEPEAYWSKVAEEIAVRGNNCIAGDDNPYYRYKRMRFLNVFLDRIDFQSCTALEVGFGPGGNLERIAERWNTKRLYGVDISPKMLSLASKRLQRFDNVELATYDGSHLPFPDRFVDICFTATVLQHVADASVLQTLARDICRATRQKIILMEDIGDCGSANGIGAWTCRRVGTYRSLFEENGFKFDGCVFLNTKVSRMWNNLIAAASDWGRRAKRRQGEPISALTKFLIGCPMPLTRALDAIFLDKRDLAMITFRRVESSMTLRPRDGCYNS